MSSRIVKFYRGEQPDHRGRFLSEIQQWDPAKLEAHHDFIQWLFPLPEPSPVNPEAPILDAAVIAEFHASAELRPALRNSLRAMLDFYGFRWLEKPYLKVEPSPNFARASRNWLTPGNHNHLRITRILRSTRLLGLEEDSRTFFEALSDIYKTDMGRRNIGRVSFDYWKSAVSIDSDECL